MDIFGYLKISLALKSVAVDQVLTKISEMDPKLDFDVFHILNYGRISKIEKISDGKEPPQKRSFLGGSRALKPKDLGYVSDRNFTRISCLNPHMQNI